MQVVAAAAVGSRSRVGQAEPQAVEPAGSRLATRPEVWLSRAWRGAAWSPAALCSWGWGGGEEVREQLAGAPARCRLADGLVLRLPPFLPRRR